jgi:hypothetical protein
MLELEARDRPNMMNYMLYTVVVLSSQRKHPSFFKKKKESIPVCQQH